MATLDIAAESSVQGIDTKIGATNDSISTATVMGKLNKVISYLDTTETVTENTETLVNSEISSTWQLVGTFTPTKTGLHLINSRIANVTGHYSAQLYIASQTLTSSNRNRGKVVSQRGSTTYIQLSKQAYLTSGMTYYFYIGASSSSYSGKINSLTVSWSDQKDDLEKVVINSGGGADRRLMELITASGSGTTEVKAAEWKVLFDGIITVRVNKTDTTYLKVYVNNTLESTNEYTDTVYERDVSVSAGDTVKVNGYASAAGNSWQINSILMCFALSRYIGSGDLLIV